MKLAVPSGLVAVPTLNPTLKRWAIFKHPSGIKTEILVALDEMSPAREDPASLIKNPPALALALPPRGDGQWMALAGDKENNKAQPR